MLLLPYRDKSVARSVPVVTAAILLACVVVLYGFQGQDAARDRDAITFYRDSGLEKIELPKYQEYLLHLSDEQSSGRLHLLQAYKPETGIPAQVLQTDTRFVTLLHAGDIVHEKDPEYASWKTDRAHFEEMLAASFRARFDLDRSHVKDAWRFVTYAFLHSGTAHLLGNMLVLILVGPFVEAALGRVRYLLAYLVGGAAAGAMHLLVSDAPVIGASGAIAATVGMLAVLYGTRKVPVFYWVFFIFGTMRLPALALLPIWLLNEAYQWSLQARSPFAASGVAYGAHVGGLCAGALIAWLLTRRHGSKAVQAAIAQSEPKRTERGSSLAQQAQEAATHLDVKRATRLYRELVDLEQGRMDYLQGYLNVALLGADEEALQDAALRLLWTKFRTPTDEMRKIFLQLTQPKVLKALPIDEHLRLARRLVRFREDGAALRVIDALLRDDHLRELYGRQLADCLLGLFTAYTRHGLNKQAEQIQQRLSSYFPSADQLGGLAPTHRPPSTILSSMRPTISRMQITSMGNTSGPRPPPRRGE